MSNSVKNHLPKLVRKIVSFVESFVMKIAVLLVSLKEIPSTCRRLKREIEEECYEIPIKTVECNILREPERILVDVIFVHGLDGSMGRSWQQGTWEIQEHREQKPIFSEFWNEYRRKRKRKNIPFSESSELSACWPKEWIPQDCEYARIISIDYITGWLWCPPFIKEREGNNMLTRSNEMIKELMKLGVGKRPIVWAGHSKGGLYIKQIIVNAKENYGQTEEVGSIFKNSKAIAWYGVPHRGSTISNYTLPLLRRSVPLLETEKNCDFLLNLHKTFLQVIKEADIEISSFMETKPTRIAPFVYGKIITLESAEPNIGRKYFVPVNHIDICKPRGRHCHLYVELLRLIKKSMIGTQLKF